MKRLFLIFTFCSGCASYTQSKIDLTAQAQAGVSRVRDVIETHASQSAADADGLRDRLDAAFDVDVATRSEEALTSEWIIAHSKAYAAAIDAFERRRASAAANDAAALGMLNAIDLALTQLQQMHASELRFTLPSLLPEVKR